MSVPMKLPANASPEARAEQQRQLTREMDAIGKLFSRGYNEHEIRGLLGLSRKKLDHRVRRMRKLSLDAPLVWMKFLQGAQQDLKALYYIYAKAVKETDAQGRAKPRYTAALDAVSKMHDVRRSIVEMGQECGVYDRKEGDFGVGLSELTLALLVGTASRGGLTGLPSGNIHSTPPADLAQLPPLVRDALSGNDVVDGELVEDDDEDDILDDDGNLVDESSAA